MTLAPGTRLGPYEITGAIGAAAPITVVLNWDAALKE